MVFRPVDRRGLTPGHQGRFGGFDVLEQVPTWDDVTAGTVLARLAPPPEPAFFTPQQWAAAECLFDQLLGQREEPKIPVVAMVDLRLAKGETDGWHYQDMPADGDAFRDTLAFLDDDARDLFGPAFAELGWDQQATVVQLVQDRTGERWHGLAGKHVWSLWTRYACAAFYSHPWAWNEIGFGGPAYPRGYKNLGLDSREAWERQEEDPKDPVGWGDRAETARRRHAEQVRGARSEHREQGEQAGES